MALMMVAAAVYGVLQLAVLTWPVRSVGLPVVLASIVVGIYGSGVAVALAELGAVRGWLPVASLAVALAADHRFIRRGKAAMPGVLLAVERTGHTSTAALAGFAAHHLPYTSLIAARFARLRRGLLYAATRTPPERLEDLHSAVALLADRIDAASHDAAWDPATRARIRRALAGHRTVRRHRIALCLIPLLLATPAVLALGAGSFPATEDLQGWFASGTGYTLLLAAAIAGLAWLALQLALLARAWRPTAQLPHAAPLTALRLRLYATAGALTLTGLLLYQRLNGTEPDDRAVPLYPGYFLLAYLEQLLFWTLLALAIGSLLFIPPAGGAAAAALAGGGLRIGTIALSTEGQAMLGGAAIALATASGPHGSETDYNAWPRQKRKGRTQPKHRADVRGDEGRHGGHTVSKHVGQTARQLRQRLRAEPDRGRASTYKDEASAQRFTDETLLQNQKEIDQWLAAGKSKLPLTGEFSETTGWSLSRANFKQGLPREAVNKVRLFLTRDPSSPSGYRVLTSYPIP